MRSVKQIDPVARSRARRGLSSGVSGQCAHAVRQILADLTTSTAQRRPMKNNEERSHTDSSRLCLVLKPQSPVPASRL